MTKYLLVFAQAHERFRIPELLSVSELCGLSLRPPDDLDTTRPFMTLDLENEDHAKILVKRCILIKSIYEFYAQGATYEEIHERNLKNQSKWSRYINDTSFKFTMASFNHTIPQTRQREVIESFSYMGFMGRIDLKNPEIIIGCFEEYADRHGTPQYNGDEEDGQLRQIYLGRLINKASARSLIHTFDVKKRLYFGNTSMEAEISLIMANQALAGPGKLVYDPFMGTGSMAYPAAYFGAQIFGSDIDGRQMRGKGNPPGIIRAAAQYGVAQRIIDLCTFDITRNPWRCGELFDAIVTDPPYGVRAGAKRLGRKREPKIKQVDSGWSRPDDQPYVPPTKPYEFSHLAKDLVSMARYLLKPGGRLVFFLPTVTDEYQEVDIDTMMCEGMEVIANSLQDFGSWGRRLVTIRKLAADRYSPPSFVNTDAVGPGPQHVPAHKDFREKYFQGFKKESADDLRFNSSRI